MIYLAVQSDLLKRNIHGLTFTIIAHGMESVLPPNIQSLTYVKAVLREHRIPFEIRQDDPFYSASNQAYIMKSVTELKAGKGTAHELIGVDDE